MVRIRAQWIPAVTDSRGRICARARAMDTDDSHVPIDARARARRGARSVRARNGYQDSSVSSDGYRIRFGRFGRMDGWWIRLRCGMVMDGQFSLDTDMSVSLR